MSIKSIPKYSLEFFFQDPEIKIENPDQLLIRTRELSPSSANIKPEILEVIESLCKDYICSLGKMFKEPMTARLTLSPINGISFDPGSEKIKAVYEQITREVAIAIPKNDAISQGIQQLKKKNVSAQEKQKAFAQFQQKQILFLDPHAYQLWKSGLKAPLKIDVEMVACLSTGQGGGLTTGFLRFPHLLGDLANRFQTKRLDQQTKICIVGPGLFIPEKGTPSCPQFVEVFSLFPKANFLLLDNDTSALERMDGQFHKCKFAGYDSSMLRVYTTNIQSNTYYAPQKYQILFQQMKDLFAENALAPTNAKEMLAGIGGIKPLLLKVDPEKIHLREFDILTSAPKEEEKGTFNIVIATMSMLLAIGELDKNSSTNPLMIFRKFLELLSENGSLYVDSTLIDYLYSAYGDENMDLGLRYLELLLGNELSIEEVAIADFSPNVLSAHSTLLNLSMSNSKELVTGTNVTTSSVTVITRTAKKTEQATEEHKAELEQRLAALKPSLH